MKELTPQIIAEITGGQYVGAEIDRNRPISGAVRDSHDVGPGNLFVCIRGARVDGHIFANNAFDSGASCCLAEQRIPNAKGPYVIVSSTLEAILAVAGYHRSLFNIPIIGITGSVGKTSAKEIIAAVLGIKLCVLKTEMNMNNELGAALTLLSLNAQHEAAVIEMGISKFGDMSILAEMVRPDIFVMTKIGYAHIEELGDLQGVLRAKTEAFAYMKPDGVAVLNGDDELLLKYDPKMRKITFGQGKHNDVRAINIKTDGIDSINFDIISDSGKFHATLLAYGSHLATLALAAVIIGQLLGLTDDEICTGLTAYAPVDGRSNVICVNDITIIDDCYNASPNSVEAALESLSKLPGRHVAILGDMLNQGELSTQRHCEIGAFAAKSGIDYLICLGTQARHIYESYVCVREARSMGISGKTAVKGMRSDEEEIAYFSSDMTELVKELPHKIKKGDTVLVKASRDMHFEGIVHFLSAKSENDYQ